MRRSLYLFVGLLLLLVTGCGQNEVAVYNDLPYTVSLVGCRQNPFDIETGEERRFPAFRPCIVRRSGYEDIGCLLFPPEAFEGAVVRVSSMDTSIDPDDCPGKGHY